MAVSSCIALLGATCLILLGIDAAMGFKIFQKRIPNGGFVPHPCQPNHIWEAVGHITEAGGDLRNPFGIDFAGNGFKWDQCLCQHDSDGDGLTNGQELGDPDCTWTPGDVPKHKFGLTHPGVCDPMDSPTCNIQNTFDIECVPSEVFVCDAIHDADVRNVTLRFPPTKVPAQETIYMCMNFELPNEEEYHLVAYEPFIDNAHVLHHIMVSGCIDTDIEKMLLPSECDMGQDGCFEVISGWTVGLGGYCFPPQMGFRLGKKGYKTVSLQVHWTNPTLETNFVDGSGMILYYTPKLRANSGQVLLTGQRYLQIPPGQSNIHFDAVCSSQCTSNVSNALYIVEAQLHMHYLGVSAYSELWRNGDKIADLAKTDNYDYDNPDIMRHNTPIELLPGDEIRSRCVYDARDRDSITFYGRGSYDEMCFVLITYYPDDSQLFFCGQYLEEDECLYLNDISDLQASTMKQEHSSGNECDLEAFQRDPSVISLWMKLSQQCDPTGRICKPGCKDVIEALRRNPCMQGASGVQIEEDMSTMSEVYKAMRNMLHSCDTYDNLLADGEQDAEFFKQVKKTASKNLYDPQTNNLPLGGVCPFESNLKSANGQRGIHQGLVMELLVNIIMFLLLY